MGCIYGIPERKQQRNRWHTNKIDSIQVKINRKIGMNDLSNDEMNVTYVYKSQRSGIRVSKRELMEISVAVIVLTLVFTLVLGGGIREISDSTQGEIMFLMLAAFLAVGTGFVVHELAHKALAQRYGCGAEFRMWPLGLGLAILTGVFGWFVFAAPGAVYISGMINKEQNGRISAAGPASNLLVAMAAIPLIYIGGGLAGIAVIVAYINIILGGFNMIPLPPFDGQKVWRWNPAAYVLLVATAIILYLFMTRYLFELF